MNEVKSKLSQYKDIMPLKAEHGVFLVQEEKTNRIFVKKILTTYNIDVYKNVSASGIKGIPRILEIYEEDGILTIVEEYISGETIEDILKRQGAIPEEQVRNIIISLCNILQSLHSLLPPVIHRDIKPSNVMITSYGEVFLLDLNAAKLENTNKSEDTLLLGTYGYAAPEQYGFGTSTFQTDIYALGMLMNTMLNGEYAKDIIKNRSLSGVIEKCVMMKPEDRFDSIKDLKNALSLPGYTEKRSMLPPGFRSGNFMHMLVAIVVYIATFALCLSLKVDNKGYVFITWHERVFSLITMLAIIFFSFDYLGIQKKFPLCKSNKPLIRILGIFLFDAIFFVGMVILMVLLETIAISALGG